MSTYGMLQLVSTVPFACWYYDALTWYPGTCLFVSHQGVYCSLFCDHGPDFREIKIMWEHHHHHAVPPSHHHYRPIPPSHYHTITPSHYHTITPPTYHSIRLPTYHTITLSHYRPITLSIDLSHYRRHCRAYYMALYTTTSERGALYVYII